jgi:hypothetical protein
MGHRNTISGHIQEPWYVRGSDRAIRRLWHRNRRVINSLPAQDEWPFLMRSMFAASPIPSNRRDVISVTYRGPVIHFGGSFPSVYEVWPQWLEKFESLLCRLYWEHAIVILVTEWTGQYVYRWDAEGADFTTEVPQPIRAWKFSGEPRDFGSA